MNAIWEKFKWLLTHASWLLAALIVAIDPKHIDNLVEQHPQWAGIIMAVWALLMAWANKTKAPSEPGVYPPGTGANPNQVADRRGQSQAQQQGKPFTGGLR